MIIILFGTSCSGKTTLIKELCKEDIFEPIMCHTTRGSREDDFARISITDLEFEKLNSEGKFLIINKHLNAKYGNLTSEFYKAQVSKSKYYLIDYFIGDKEKFSNLEYKPIIITPINEKILIAQIDKSGRLDRREKILRDYRENYNKQKLSEYSNEGIPIIKTNGNIDDTVKKFKEIIDDIF